MSVQYITQRKTSPSASAKQTNSAIFSAPSITNASSRGRANQLVPNTFRLLIITLRQARHQYEARILKDTMPSVGTGQLCHQSLISLRTPPRLYLMADMTLIVLISLLHFYLLYKAEAAPSAGAASCSGCAVSEWLIYMRYLS